MQTMQEAAAAFLTKRRIAVTGVSRHGKDHGAPPSRGNRA